MRTFTAVVEKCPDTGLYVGYVPGFAGAHSQAETLDELQRNLREVIAVLLEDGEAEMERRQPRLVQNARRRKRSSLTPGAAYRILRPGL
jgi:predicted RNase H-like HicB family nuclease